MEAAPDPGRTGVDILGGGVSDEHDDSAGVGAATDRRGLSGADVYCVGADCAVPQGV